MKDATKKKRKEPQLQNIITTINGLHQRIRYSETDYENTKSRSISEILDDIEKLEQRFKMFAPELEEIEVRIAGRRERLNTLRAEHEKVEDGIFNQFCEDIGVENIRAYEEKELHKQQQNSKRRLEFENQHSRLINLLEYEQSNDTMVNVRKWQDVIQKDEKELIELKVNKN